MNRILIPGSADAPFFQEVRRDMGQDGAFTYGRSFGVLQLNDVELDEFERDLAEWVAQVQKTAIDLRLAVNVRRRELANREQTLAAELMAAIDAANDSNPMIVS